jgi:hypothetical protein
MGIRYDWADERQMIMAIYLEAPWTWAEYGAMMSTVMPMLAQVKRPCATVVDCTQMGDLPRDGRVMDVLLSVEKMMPANVFASVVVAAPQLVSVFMNVLTKLRPRAERLAIFTSTMEEAKQKIYARYQQDFGALDHYSSLGKG